MLNDNGIVKVIWLCSPFRFLRQIHPGPHFAKGVRDESRKDLIIIAL